MKALLLLVAFSLPSADFSHYEQLLAKSCSFLSLNISWVKLPDP